jgi:endonuclease/exonuclease/phosphatase (EEP) superfamily protein YafD
MVPTRLENSCGAASPSAAPLMGRRVWTALGVVMLVVAAVAFVVRFLPMVNLPLVVMAASAPYLMLGAPIGVLVFAAVRRWLAALLAAGLTVATVAVQVPYYVGNDAPEGVSVRFMSANLRYGHADPEAVARLARERADVLAVQELTPDEADRLEAAGIDRDFPHRALQPQDGPAGVGIWSRYPIVGSSPFEGFWLGLLTAQVRIPDIAANATVVATHMSAPWPEPIKGWRDDIARFATALQQIATSTPGAVMVGGDLNATVDMREFRRLLHDGYRDAAEQAGAGLTRTHPADIVVPPVFAVDHILTRGCTATSVRTLTVPGSDHRALIARIVVHP